MVDECLVQAVDSSLRAFLSTGKVYEFYDISKDHEYIDLDIEYIDLACGLHNTLAEVHTKNECDIAVRELAIAETSESYRGDDLTGSGSQCFVNPSQDEYSGVFLSGNDTNLGYIYAPDRHKVCKRIGTHTHTHTPHTTHESGQYC